MNWKKVIIPVDLIMVTAILMALICLLKVYMAINKFIKIIHFSNSNNRHNK